LPGWLPCSRWFTHNSGHPSAAGRAQDRESLPAKHRRSIPLCHTIIIINVIINLAHSYSENFCSLNLILIFACRFATTPQIVFILLFVVSELIEV